MHRQESAEAGFTIIEMTIAIGLLAGIFTVMAAVMATSMRSLAVAKQRSRANEVATQAIEDLQRFGYDYLGVCKTASKTAPTGLETPASLNNCSNPVYEDPCHSSTGTVPEVTYACTINATTFTVSRYVAWGDGSQTQKRMAVLVDWTDQVGQHEVAEQSSMRAPDPASTIGNAPPAFSSVSVNPYQNVALDQSGSQTITHAPVNVSAQTIGLSAPQSGSSTNDVVYATIATFGGGQWTQVQLTSVDGQNWNGNLPAGTAVGAGSQYVALNAVRYADGKAASTVFSPAVSFSCSTCTGVPPAPTVSSVVVNPTTISIDTAGLLYNSFQVTATTTNVTSNDRVYVLMQTVGGMVAQTLSTSNCPTSSSYPLPPSSPTTCTWGTTVSASTPYRFPQGQQNFYVVAEQSNVSGTVDVGSTAAGASGQVSFQ